MTSIPLVSFACFGISILSFTVARLRLSAELGLRIMSAGLLIAGAALIAA